MFSSFLFCLIVSGPSLYCWSSLFRFIIFFRVCLTSPSLFFKNDTDSLKNLFLRWTLQYLACKIQFSSLLEQEQNIYEILGMKEKDTIALTVFFLKKVSFQTLETMQTHFPRWQVLFCFAFCTYWGMLGICVVVKPFVQWGTPPPPTQMGWWGWLCSAVRNPGRRVVGRLADSPSRTMRDSAWNPLRERSYVSRILSCYILGTKGRGLERTGGREWSNQRFKMGLDSGRDLGQEVSQDGL